MSSKPLLRLLTLALALGLPASALAAGNDQIVIGLDNTVSELLSGTYGELFPDDPGSFATNPVLALDVVSADGRRARWLVPSTETADSESYQLLVYERTSNRVYVFWETVINGIHPALYLTSFDGERWGQLIEFVGAPFARKKSLELVISRSSGVSMVDGEPEMLTVLHVFWAEERPGISEKRYAPIVLVNGEYAGSTPVYELGNLAAVEGESGGFPASEGILDGIQAQVGADSRSCVVGFLDPSTQLVKTLEIELLPPIVTSLADKIRAEIIGLGWKVTSLDDVAEAVRTKLLEFGAGLHSSVLTYMIDRVDGVIRNEEPQPLNDDSLGFLGDKIRAEIIGLGARIGPGGLAEQDGVRLVELSSSTDGATPARMLKVTPASSRQAPQVDGDASMWLSDSGQHVLVTWEDEHRIYYRESLDESDGWSEVGAIELGNGLDREDIYRTLAERARSH